MGRAGTGGHALAVWRKLFTKPLMGVEPGAFRPAPPPVRVTIRAGGPAELDAVVGVDAVAVESSDALQRPWLASFFDQPSAPWQWRSCMELRSQPGMWCSATARLARRDMWPASLCSRKRVGGASARLCRPLDVRRADNPTT